MDEILSISDLFILTSSYESFGLSALEAMSCGVPVISTNAGGLGEINVHGFTGYLSNVGDVEDMATHAFSILENETVLNQFKNQAKEHAMKFEKQFIIPQYEQLYNEVVQSYKKA
jgi:glycosyltransferase involved in cell wall biosynthesis